jgi:hypothetical protein
MAITEDDRLRMQRTLRRLMGERDAVTLMEHLPPVGWADVATRRDLDHLHEQMEARFEAIDARFEAIDARFEAIDARFEATEPRLRSHVDRGLRRNLAVTVSAIGLANAGTVAALRLVGG